MHLLITGELGVTLTWSLLYRFLTELPPLLDLNVIFGPHIHHREDGWIGVVVIAESHVSVHTKGNIVWVDVFSCKEFSPEETTDYITRFFRVRNSNVHLLKRVVAEEEPINDRVLVPALRGVV